MRTTSETVRHLVRAAGAFTVAASAIVLLVSGTSAASKGEPHGDNCSQGKIASNEVQHSISDRRYLTVTGLVDRIVDAIVVKGAGTSYTYRASELGDLPWTRLHAPDHGNITTWYACGVSPKGTPPETTTTTTTTDVTTTTTTPGTTTTTTPNTTTTTTSGSTTTTSSGSTTTTTTGSTTTGSTTTTTGGSTPSTTPTTTTPTTWATPKTTAPLAVAASNKDKLASTGFNATWLLLLGGGLVAAGIAFVASPKLRGLVRR